MCVDYWIDTGYEDILLSPAIDARYTDTTAWSLVMGLHWELKN